MTKTIFNSLTDLFKNVAKEKHRAAISKHQDLKCDELPRNVYDDSCEQIAAALISKGFSYSKSSHHLTRRNDDLKFTIHFQSSYNNVAGELVSLIFAANIRSRIIKKWRIAQSRPLRKDEWIAGGLIHLIDGNNVFIRWNLADKESRKETINDIITQINEIAIPFFDKFLMPEMVINELTRASINAFNIGDQIEYSLCFSGIRKAQMVLNRFLSNRPDLLPDILKSKDNLKENGFPDYFVTRHSDVIAHILTAYDLKI